ncbi:MAG: hypothetical protein ABEJ79_03410 [Halolamina sp.]
MSDTRGDGVVDAAGDATVSDRAGRTALGLIAALTVGFAAAVGWFAGTNAEGPVQLYGVVAVPGTPVAVALAGVVVTGSLLALLVAGVAAASRVED